MIVKRFVYVFYLRFTDFDFKLFLDDTFYNGISCLFLCKKSRDLFILKSQQYIQNTFAFRTKTILMNQICILNIEFGDF